ncbi:LysR family transcriptional regulator [Seohaeicola saemankumensis]|nr:LysR family transcriptional regulator [Seohaeicola saemankumensis]MCA0873846.1 LysR family transcriptional regulator [Seohaeicola saemankumensis]
MDVDWDDLKTVLALVRAGSLAAAGAALGVNYTTVARRVQRAEAAVGVPLFERLAGGYQATETGLLVAEHASEMEARENALLRRLQGRDQTLSGPLVITAPQLLIGPMIAPVLDRFSTLHPDVSVKIRATNDLLNLNRREADLAIRISRNPGDTLMGLRLCAQHGASFASPELAARIAADPQGRIDWIVYEFSPQVPKKALELYPNSRVRMVFDDMVAMLGAARAGLGVVRMPLFLGRTTPGLVQVPMLPPQPYIDIWVVAHPDVWRSAKVTAFRDLLVPQFRKMRHLFVSGTGSEETEQVHRETNA